MKIPAPSPLCLAALAAVTLLAAPAPGRADEAKSPTAYPVRVEVKEAKNRVVEGSVRQHKLYVDQPKAFGADDSAPTPPETLAFAVGSCVVSTGRLLAMQRKLPVRHLSAVVEGTLDFALALGAETKKRAGFEGLTIAVTVDADLTEPEKREFLKEVGRRCPMCDNLANATPVSVALKPEAPAAGR